MNSEQTDPVKSAVDRKVPEELLERLHAANQRLHAAREGLQHAADDLEFDHQKKVDQATAELNASEKAVEEISEQIHRSLQSMPGAAKPA